MLIPMLARIIIALSVTYLWLYLSGNEYTAITGGWVSQAWSGVNASWIAKDPTLPKQTTYMSTYMSDVNVSTRSGVVRTTNLVDLSAVNTIRITLSGTLAGKDVGGTAYQEIYLFVANQTTGDWISPSVYDALALVKEHYPASLNAIETLNSVSYTLDVSGVPDGNYYVCLGLAWAYQSGASTLRIEAVEMIAG